MSGKPEEPVENGGDREPFFNELETALDHAEEIIHVIDKDFRVIYGNSSFFRAVKETTKQDPSKAIGGNLFDVLPFLGKKMESEYKKVFKTKKQVITEEKNTIEGEDFYTRVRKVPLFKDGRVEKILTVVRDITKQKKVEEELKESEKQYRELVDNASVGIYKGNLTGEMLFVNKTLARMFEFGSPKEMMAHGALARYQDLCDKKVFIENLRENGEVHNFEIGTTTKKGKARRVLVSASLKDGIISGMVRDITRRKQAEEALQESEEKYRNLVERANDGICIIQDTVVKFANHKLTEMIGYTEEKLLGTSFPDYVHPDELSKLQRAHERFVSGKDREQRFETTLVRKDKSRFEAFLNISETMFDEQAAALVIIHDISEYKQTEEALRESEEKYRNLVERANDGIAIIQDGVIKYANQQVMDIVGYTPEELKDTPFSRYLHPDELHKLKDRYRRRMAGEDVPAIYETILRHKDGSDVTVEINAGITTFFGRPGDLALVRNITERKKIEERLRVSEENYRSFVENFQGIAFRTHANWTPIFFHGAVQEITGYTEDDFLAGKPRWDQVVHEDDLSWLMEKYPPEIFSKPGFSAEREYRIIRKDGEVRWVHDLIQAISDGSGNVIFHQGGLYDITDRKEAEKALRESEETYRTLTEHLNVGVFRNTPGPKGKFIEVNPAIVEMFGYDSKEEFLNVKVSQLYKHPGERKRYGKKMVKNGSVRNEVLELKKKDKSTFWASVTAVAIPDNEGKVRYYDGIIEDITARKEIQEALRLEMARLEELLESSPEAIVMTDNDGKVLHVNSEFSRMFGFTSKEASGRLVDDLVAPGELNQEANLNTQRMAKGERITQEAVRRHKDGSPIDASLLGAPVVVEGKQVGVYCIYRDISERKNAEKLQKVIYEITAASNTSQDLDEFFAIIKDQLGKIVDTTNFFIVLYDKESDTLSLPFFVDEKDEFTSFPAGKTITALVIRNNKALLLTEADIERMAKTGEIEIHGTPSKIWLGVPLIVQGEVIGAVVVQSYEDASRYTTEDQEILKFVSDQISVAIARRKAEKKIRETNRELSNAKQVWEDTFTSMADGISIHNETFEITQANDALCELLGKKREELIGKKCYEIFHQRYSPPTYCPMKRTRETGEKCIEEVYEPTLDRYFLISTSPITSSTENGETNGNGAGNGSLLGVVHSVRDITELKEREQTLKKLNEELEVSNKMKSEFVSIVSHDFGNPLGVILGNLELMMMGAYGELTPKIKEKLESMQETTRRLNKLRTDTLDLTKMDLGQLSLEKEEFDLCELTYKVVEELNPKIEEKKQPVLVTCPENGLMISADHSRVFQVVENYLSNAIRYTAKGKTVEVFIEEKGAEVILRVKDEGRGIPSEELENVFLRFYRIGEKVAGSTGLGLSIVKGIVKAHGGRCWAESEGVGRGSTFCFTLPK